MTEKQINLSNKVLYYLVSPCLLCYFILIDVGIVKCSLLILGIFALLIVIGIINILKFRKVDPNYKFIINDKYGKVMFILVLLELSYSFTK